MVRPDASLGHALPASIAQLVEQVTLNHKVPGSSPGGGIVGPCRWIRTRAFEAWRLSSILSGGVESEACGEGLADS